MKTFVSSILFLSVAAVNLFGSCDDKAASSSMTLSSEQGNSVDRALKKDDQNLSKKELLERFCTTNLKNENATVTLQQLCDLDGSSDEVMKLFTEKYYLIAKKLPPAERYVFACRVSEVIKDDQEPQWKLENFIVARLIELLRDKALSAEELKSSVVSGLVDELSEVANVGVEEQNPPTETIEEMVKEMSYPKIYKKFLGGTILKNTCAGYPQQLLLDNNKRYVTFEESDDRDAKNAVDGVLRGLVESLFAKNARGIIHEAIRYSNDLEIALHGMQLLRDEIEKQVPFLLTVEMVANNFDLMMKAFEQNDVREENYEKRMISVIDLLSNKLEVAGRKEAERFFSKSEKYKKEVTVDGKTVADRRTRVPYQIGMKVTVDGKEYEVAEEEETSDSWE